MGAFWETFGTANEASVATLGEFLWVDGVEMNAIVDNFRFKEGAAAGGRKTMVGGYLNKSQVSHFNK